MDSHQATKHKLVSFCERMYARGFVFGKEGNLSARASDGTIWMTPAGMNKADVTEDALVRLNLEGAILEGACKPTSEKFTHLEAYRRRPDVHAVVHGHPVYCTAFAAAHVALPARVLPEIVAVIGEIPFVPYATPSSEKLAMAIAPYYEDHDCFLLQNHGALALGDTIDNAYYKLEVMESYARVILLTHFLGGPKELSEQQLIDLPRPVRPRKRSEGV